MSLSTQYTGASPAANGASFLNSRAILKVEEGYVNGATTEYVSQGLFELRDYTDTAPFRRKLTLSADRQDLRLSDTNLIVPRALRTSYVLNEPFENFNDEYLTYNGEWSIVKPRVIGSSLVTGLSPVYLFLGAAGNLRYEGLDVLSPNNFRDVRVTTRMAASDFTPATAAIFSLSLYRIKTDQDHSVTGNRIVYETQYLFGNEFGATQLIQLYRRDYLGATLLKTGGFASLTDNVFYWFRSEVVDNTVRMYISSDDSTYTNLLTHQLPMETYPGSTNPQVGYGKVSMEFHTTVGVTFQIDDLEVAELGKVYTREDVVKSIYAMGGIMGVTVPSQFAHFAPNFQASSGSSWVLSGENLYLVGTSAGSSYHYYISSGNSFNNFMAEVEVKGASGMRAGLLVGSTDIWYSTNTAFKMSSDTIEERFMRSRVTRSPVAEWLITKPDIWHKLRLVKRNQELFWLIEEKLYDYAIGSSLIDSMAVNVGVHSLRNSGAVGATLQYRNFRISSMGDIVDDAQIAPNTKLSSLISRYMPDDFNISPLGNGYEIYKFGTSRGQHNVDLGGVVDFSQSRDDLIAPVSITAEGQAGLANQRKTGNARKAVQADIADTTLLEDLSLKTSEDLKRMTDAEALSYGRRLATFQVTAPLIPMLDIFDSVGLSSFEGNISGNFHVQSIRKSYNAQDGSFTQDLILSYGTTQL